MKTKRFLSLAAIFAIVLAFFACQNELPPEQQGGQSSSSDSPFEPPGGESSGGSQVNNSSSSSLTNSSSSSLPNGGSSSSTVTVIPEAFQFLGSGYNVITSAYINPDYAIKHRNYPVLNRDKMFQDGLFEKTNQPHENFETVAGNSIKKTIHNRSLKIGASVEATLPSLPFFSGGISVDFQNVKNSKMSESISFVKLNYTNYKEDLSIKNATKEKLKDYLTETFKNDLKAKKASEIIESYGTHIFIQYYRGGSLEANYTYTYNDKEDDETARTAAGVTFTGIAGAKVEGDYSKTINTSNFEKDANLAFKYQSFGGDTYGVGNLDDLRNKFSKWANSIKESNAVICGIADFKSSLIPIWDLASAGGFTTEANALKAEFYSRAGNVKFEAARAYKTLNNPIEYKINGTYTVSLKDSIPTADRAKATVAEVEIYALGAGGGGQGGDYNVNILKDAYGTGGAGGGGQAAYLKLGLNGENPTLSITVGKGGLGGDAIITAKGGTNTSGCNGGNGGPTTVKWTAENITFSAGGGLGGNGNASCIETGGTGTEPGKGGTGRSINPSSSKFYIETPLFDDGKDGTKGNFNETNTTRTTPPQTKGGNSGKIDNSFPSFPFNSGKDNGGYLTSLTQANYASNGGGGFGGYDTYNGGKGGDGQVKIVVRYYTEE